MSKKIIISIFIILALGMGTLILVIFLNIEPAPEPFLCNGQPCNVILIIPETLSARHMGIYGYERDTTPFIDEFFSEESLIFESAWSNAPWTIPSFASLYTSQLASDVHVKRWEDKLSDGILTFVDVLGKNKIPKFSAHTWTLFSPLENDTFLRQFEPEERLLAKDPFLFLKAAEWVEEQTQKDDGQPFFLLLQPFAPHTPYDPPKPYRYLFGAPSEYPGPITNEDIFEARASLQQGKNIELEIRRFRLQYDQEIRYLDNEFENFISRLPEEVLQTMVFIFTSDHGEAFGQYNNFLHGLSLYEEVIHAPFLLRAPGIEHKKIQEPVTLLDVGPTILGIFGLKSPETFQGISLVPLLRGKELQIEDRIVRAEEFHHERLPIEEWSEIEPQVWTEPLPCPRETAVRRGNWKLLRRPNGFLELYNLDRDYYEQDNLLPQWTDLSPEEQLEVFPLFEALSEMVLFIYEE